MSAPSGGTAGSAAASHAAHLDEVRTYYDRNTRAFSEHESAVARAVHRAVWGPGVADRAGAFEYVNRLIAEVVAEAAPAGNDEPAAVLDLGCGVGGTLLYLAERMPIDGVGVTLSPVQAEVAAATAARLGLADRCAFAVADYLDLPPVGPRAAAYAVESFVHGPDPAAFFRSAAAALAPGGRLVVCDDFLSPRGAACDGPAGEPPAGMTRRQARRGRRHLAEFRRGWILGSLVTAERAAALARDAGLALRDDRDLTPWLELRRPIDLAIAVAVTLGRHLPLDSPRWRSWLGGHAIQRCLLEGLVEYRFLVFEKV